MAYRLSRRAEEDLLALYARGIERFGFERTERYVAEPREVLDLIGDNPLMARERRESTPAMRVHPHHAHLIIYTASDAGVLIARILDARQDWRALP